MFDNSKINAADFMFLRWHQYACRKTLADNRPRIRGRFARNDETGEIPKATCSTSIEDDDDLWVNPISTLQFIYVTVIFAQLFLYISSLRKTFTKTILLFYGYHFLLCFGQNPFLTKSYLCMQLERFHEERMGQFVNANGYGAAQFQYYRY